MLALNNISNITNSVFSETQVYVAIYFSKEQFNQSKKLFETFCKSLHFPNYSYLEMKGNQKKNNVKTHYILYFEEYKDWNKEKNQYDDLREKINNFDPQRKEFRNYDYLDYFCEAEECSKDIAREKLDSLKTNNRYLLEFFDPEKFPLEEFSVNDILSEIWGDKRLFENLGITETEELKCRLEHQHWCSEKLMNGFRELTKKELGEFQKFRLSDRKPISDSKDWLMHKDMHDKKRLYASMKYGAHLDLCSFDELFYRDFGTIYHDLKHFDNIISEEKKHDNEEKVDNKKSTINPRILKFFVLLIVTTGTLFLLNYYCLDRLWNQCDSWFSLVFSSIALTGGFLGCNIFINNIKQVYKDPEIFDRFLANFTKKSLIKVLITIMSIPCIIAVFAFFVSLVSYICTGFVIIDTNVMFNGHGMNTAPNLLWTFIYQFIDPGNQHMVGNHVGLMWAFPVAILGMFCLNGFLVSSVINYIERHVQNWREGKTRYHFDKQKHIVIIGGHELIIGILNQLDKPDIDRFIIMTEQDVQEFRVNLCSHVNDQLANKLVLYKGDRTSRKDIENLYLNDSSLHSVYVIGEGTSHDNLEPNHDTKNMTCTDLIAYARNSSIESKLHCYVMFEHRSSYVAFQQAELPESYKSRLLFEPFNIFEMCAQNLLVMPQYPIKPIDISRFSEDLFGEKNYIDIESKRRVHLIIFGMSKMGMALASEAAIICHYPNYAKIEMLEDYGIGSETKKDDLRLRITFIDLDAEQQMKFYQNRMPSLFEISKWKYMDGRLSTEFKVTDKMEDCPTGFEYENLIDKKKKLGGHNFLDVEWEFISGALGDQGVSQYLKDIIPLKNEILTIAVCLPNAEEGLSLASTIPVDVYDKAEQILVYQRHTSGIVKQMAGNYKEMPFDQKSNRFEKMRPFGMYSTCFNQKFLDNDFATKIYSKNYEKLKTAIRNNKPINEIQLVDLSSLSILERWSAVYSAHNWSVKFRSMGVLSGELPTKEKLEKEFGKVQVLIENTDETHANIWGRVEHNRWNLERLIKIGERPINIFEFENIAFKESYKKGAQRSHLNICSMKRLRDEKDKDGKIIAKGVDPGVVKYDIDRNYRLVEIYDALKESK